MGVEIDCLQRPANADFGIKKIAKNTTNIQERISRVIEEERAIVVVGKREKNVAIEGGDNSGGRKKGEEKESLGSQS